MLDAFIIEQLKKNEDQKDWQPASLPLELPIADVFEDMEDIERKRKEDRNKKCVIRL